MLPDLLGCSIVPDRYSQLREIQHLTDAWSSQSQIHQDLISLPKPINTIPISVFNFKDQTGQYKPAPANAFSTVVTQGATTMVVEALADSGWFLPLEREGLQNLLTERKIIRARNGETSLPPLFGANLMIEGGIIGYDSNIKTGGMGAQYLGIGANEQYRMDALTINLRTVDTATSKIIHSITVNKTILSQEIATSIFRFVKFKRLLEAEGGMTRNDPTQLILKDAIDTAAIRLIITGLVRNNWSTAKLEDLTHPILLQYASPDYQSRLHALKHSLTQNRQPSLSQHTHIPKTPFQKSKKENNTSASPKSNPPSLTKELFSIQLAASEDLEKLEALRKEWNLAPDVTSIIKINKAKKKWYALQFGHFKTLEQANRTLKQLPKQLKSFEPWVTQSAFTNQQSNSGTSHTTSTASDTNSKGEQPTLLRTQ